MLIWEYGLFELLLFFLIGGNIELIIFIKQLYIKHLFYCRLEFEPRDKLKY